MDKRLQRLGGVAALSAFPALAFNLLFFFVYLPSVGVAINDMSRDPQTELRMLTAARAGFLWDGVVLTAFFSFRFVLVHALYVRMRDSAPTLSVLAAVFGYASTALIVLEQVRVYTLANAGSRFNPDQFTHIGPTFDALQGFLEDGSFLLGIPWVLLFCIASLRNRELTRPVAYLGILAAAWDVLTAVGVLPNHGPTGNPLGGLTLIALAIVLLIRPDPRAPRARKAAAEPISV